MTEIEKVKGEIKVLQSKLALLEEMEDHMEQEIQKAFDKVCGGFPPNLSGDRFDFFRWGYEAHQSLVDDAKKIIDEASFTNCIIEGNPPDGCGSWSEWFKLFGSKGILHNLRISSKNNKTPEPYCPDAMFEEAERREKSNRVLQRYNDFYNMECAGLPHGTPITPEHQQMIALQCMIDALRCENLNREYNEIAISDIEDLIARLDEQATAFLKKVREFKDSADGVA